MLAAKFDVMGKVILITGPGRGIGKGIAQVLADTGVDIAPNALTPEYVEGTAAFGRCVVPVVANVTKADAVRRAIEEVLAYMTGQTIPLDGKLSLS